jgi:flagellin-specific chaperone FliS
VETELVPLAKDSQYFFSGLYQVAVTTCTLQEIRELTFNTRYQAVRDLEEANRISDVDERDSKVQRIKDIAEAQLTLYSSIRQETLEDCRQNLTRLYGDLPKPIFQRLLSVELRKPMGRLPYP